MPVAARASLAIINARLDLPDRPRELRSSPFPQSDEERTESLFIDLPRRRPPPIHSPIVFLAPGDVPLIGNHEILVAVKAATKAAWHAGRGLLDHDDCVSEAHEAVAHAMRTFDPSKGCSLSTYAANRARWQAKKLLHRAAKALPMPTEWFEHVATHTPAPLAEMFEGPELRAVVLWLEYGYTYRQIADHMDVSCFHVFEIMQRVKKKLSDGAGKSAPNAVLLRARWKENIAARRRARHRFLTVLN
jgi:DNA-directed RNA polymerase specialized sigma24 family protein